MADLDRDDRIYVGKSVKSEYLMLRYGNRRGLVTGATGTGKTVTLQVLGEGFARAGVSVFANRVAGQIVGNMGKSTGGSMGNTVGRAIVRGALGGILRR